MSEPIRVGDDLTQFTLRLIQNCADEATATFWERRAKAFESAISRPTDYPGRRSAEEREAADEKNRRVAQACRNKAAFIRRYGTVSGDEVIAALADLGFPAES